MPTRTKLEIGLVAALLISCGVIWYTYSKASIDRDQHAQEAAFWAGQAKGHDAAEASSKATLDKVLAENRALAARYASIVVPPAPGKPPALPVITQKLLDAGLAPGLTVGEEFRVSEITKGDGEKIWTWEQQAERVPPLEEKVKAGEEVQAGLVKESAQKDLIIATADEAKLAQQKRAEEREAQIASMVKQERLGKFKTFLKITGAAIIGYYAGHSLHK